ncbi:MAG: T9SS type A sorting domain-containing protein [Bacteroidota bacterium]
MIVSSNPQKSIAQTTFPWVANYNSSAIEEMSNVSIIRKNQLVFSSYLINSILNRPVQTLQTNPSLYRTTLDGTLQTSKFFWKLGDTYIQYISNVFDSDDDSLVLIGDGLHENDSIPTIVFAKCDTNFNIGTIKTYPVFNYYRVKEYYSSEPWGGSIFKKHPSGGYYGVINITGWKRDQGGWMQDTPYINHYYRFDKNGNMLHESNISNVSNGRRPDVEYSPLLKQYITANISNESYLLDSSFRLIKYTPSGFVNGVSNEHLDGGINSIISYKNKHIISGGYYRYENINNPNQTWYNYGYISLVLLNDSFRRINNYFIRPIPSDSINNKTTASFKTIDYYSEDSIFIVYYFPQWYLYTVFMVDSNFKVKWAYQDSLSEFVNLQSVKATPDGGCLILGSLENGLDLDLVVIKYEKSGMKASIRYFESNMNEITIYPNPSSDKIFVSGESKDRNFLMYDLQGRIVLNANESQLIDGINISFLNEGIYFYKITNKLNGSIKSGKWIKSN